ncbi:membrane protein [Sphaerisporangium krabiense]|uniref:Putative membrane protein YdbT with pleckstrin-like domain n=1 Tax=Sphaerisporangium krabiense TaxID=763782 RepID=A0A7W8YZL9_9ACTN|nr:PH domain-containing protein [Sphaerisporangium krabiense]MBB5624724.1 putative membrane protein YdbT with pleckstrin-like domain [Sphaerisporangium krabiense]GII61315.1 membrane protein [Sphaerisporangium krabiense]
MGLPEHHLTTGERVIHSFHPHWKRLVVPFLALLLVVAASSLAFLYIPTDYEYVRFAWLAVAVVSVVALTLWSFIPYLRWKTTSYTLSTHRFNISTGILNKSTDDIPLAKVNSVSSDQTFVERLLGCGTLVVESASDKGEIVLRDIPKIQTVRAELFRLVEDASDGEIDGK